MASNRIRGQEIDGLIDECESDSTIDSLSEDLFSQDTETVDSMLDGNDDLGTSIGNLLNDSDSSSDDEEASATEINDGNLRATDEREGISNDTADMHLMVQKCARIKPKIARMAAKIEALLLIRNGGITFWHSKQSVQMLPFPDISMCLKLVHLEIS